MTDSHTDAEMIKLCRNMTAVCHEQDKLVERDASAPYTGPNHDRYEALDAKFASLAAALTKAALPVTPEGIRVLAEVAMVFSDRDTTGELTRPETIGDWLKTATLIAATGKSETLPLPSRLPEHWPAKA